MSKSYLVAAIILLLASSRGYASTDINIGGTVGYIWWKPAWQDSKTIVRGVPSNTPAATMFVEDSGDFKPSSNFSGGPIVSISFLEKWSISSIFIIGRYYFRETSPSISDALVFMGGTPLSAMSVNPANKYERDCLKWDSDSTISYSFNKYVRLFAGVKIQGYNYEQRLYITGTGAPNILARKLSDHVQNYGPGLGIGINIPLVENFYLMINFSGLFLWGFEQIVTHESYNLNAGLSQWIFMYTPNSNFISYGCNSTITLAYYIEKINTTVAVGGRYQILFNRQKSSNLFDNEVSLNIFNKQYDHFFGITLSMIYSFHITGG